MEVDRWRLFEQRTGIQVDLVRCSGPMPSRRASTHSAGRLQSSPAVAAQPSLQIKITPSTASSRA